MGTWGPYIFENDSAWEALSEILDLENTFETIRTLFQQDIKNESVDCYESEFSMVYSILLIGLNAVRIIDEMSEQELNTPLKESIKEFMSKNNANWEVIEHEEYYKLADDSLMAAVSENSELRRLWSKTDKLDEWICIVKELQSKPLLRNY